MPIETISSSDPAALEKLQAKLKNLVENQAQMKDANAYYRKHGTCRGYEGVSEATAAEMDAHIEKAHSWEKQPFSSYMLTNNNAAIRSVKKRMEELKQKQEVGYVGWQFEGGEAVVNTELDRLQLVFEAKPDEALRQRLKRSGFKWAPSQNAWQRQLTPNAIRDAGWIEALKPLSGQHVWEIQPKAPQKTAGEAR